MRIYYDDYKFYAFACGYKNVNTLSGLMIGPGHVPPGPA